MKKDLGIISFKFIILIAIICITIVLVGVFIVSNNKRVENINLNKTIQTENSNNTNDIIISNSITNSGEQEENDIIEEGITLEEFNKIINKYNLGLKSITPYVNGEQHTFYATADGVGDFTYSKELFKADEIGYQKNKLMSENSYDLGNVITDKEKAKAMAKELLGTN